MSYRLGLIFHPTPKGTRPFCYICVTEPHWVDDKGRVVLTPADMTESEIDEQIDKLIADLESIRRSAKRKYREAKIRGKTVVDKPYEP